jgi:hypothetical protein
MLLSSLVVLELLPLVADTHAQERPTIITNATTRLYLIRAIDGAIRRLEASSCQQVFREFTATSGASLESVLAEAELSPRAALSRIRFVDGSQTPQCQTHGDAIAAYTAPGYHVIFVCSDRFATRYRDQPKAAQMLVIHGLLHTLGLGENPPASGEITARVTKRCGA